MLRHNLLLQSALTGTKYSSAMTKDALNSVTWTPGRCGHTLAETTVQQTLCLCSKSDPLLVKE
jgi:hypothetical protein